MVRVMITKMLIVFVVLGFCSVDITRACLQRCTCDKFMGLKRLSCPRSDLKEFPTGIDSGTQFLRLEGNSIEEIPGNLSRLLPDLRRIDMSDNKVQRLRSRIFAGLKNLRNVNLLNNEITTIEDRIFEGSETELMNLKLGGNKVREINRGAFTGLLADSTIDLRGNLIQELDPDTFRGVRVIHLDLSYNKIKKLPAQIFDNQDDLYFMELRENNISSLNHDLFSGLTSLETLDLSSNKLHDLPVDIFKHNKALKELNLDSNNFRFPPLLDLPARKIDLTMRNNPVVCDCELKQLLSNSSYKVVVTDFNKVVCENDTQTVSEVMELIDCRTTTPPPPTTTTLTTVIATSTDSNTSIANISVSHYSAYINTTQTAVRTIAVTTTRTTRNKSSDPHINTFSSNSTPVTGTSNDRTFDLPTTVVTDIVIRNSRISRLTALILSMVTIVFLVVVGTLCWYLGRQKIRHVFKGVRKRISRVFKIKTKSSYLVNDVDNWDYKSGPGSKMNTSFEG